MKNLPKRYSLDAALEAAMAHNNCMWVMRNDCQGIFPDDIYPTRSACEAAWDRQAPEWREWTDTNGEPDGRAVPVAIIEIPQGSMAHRDAERLNREREEFSARYVASEREARARLLSVIKARSEPRSSAATTTVAEVERAILRQTMAIYRTPDQRAAVRGGMMDAAHLLDAIATDIGHAHPVRGKITKKGLELAAAITRAANRVEEMRDKVAAEEDATP